MKLEQATTIRRTLTVTRREIWAALSKVYPAMELPEHLDLVGVCSDYTMEFEWTEKESKVDRAKEVEAAYRQGLTDERDATVKHLKYAAGLRRRSDNFDGEKALTDEAAEIADGDHRRGEAKTQIAIEYCSKCGEQGVTEYGMCVDCNNCTDR